VCAVSEVMLASIVTLIGVPPGTVTPGFAAGRRTAGLEAVGLGLGAGACVGAGAGSGVWAGVCGVMLPAAGSCGFDASRLALAVAAASSFFFAPQPASSAVAAIIPQIKIRVLRMVVAPSVRRHP